MADEHDEQHEPASELKSSRGRKFVRLFLMAAGGLAAPCLALAAFFLSNSGGNDAPAAKSAVQGGQVTTTTRARTPAPAPAATTTTSTTTTTTTTPPPPGPPPRDPFVPLVTHAPAGPPAR